MTDNNRVFLHLSLIPGVSPSTCNHIIASGMPKLADLYSMTAYDMRVLSLSDKITQAIVSGLKNNSLLDRELLLLTRYPHIRVVTLYDLEYPQLLRSINTPPPLLYVYGALPVMPYVACVGSRKAEQYGSRVIDMLIPDLIASGVGIVSGGAFGIDIFAHQTVLSHSGITIAVLGTGLLRMYPGEHSLIFHDIAASGGAVISPFPLEKTSTFWQFPERNRIIAGMSLMTIVVQAAAKSGALITAEYALQEGRSVGAVPGSIEDPLSAGCHALLTQGARLIQSSNDILEECGLERLPTSDSLVVNSIEKNIKKEIFKEVAREVHDNKEVESDPVVAACFEPISIFDLCLKVAISEEELQQKLFDLQLDGKVEQDFAGLWRQVR